MRIGVDLQGHPGGRGLLDHRVQVDRVGIAGEEQPAGWMTDDREIRIIHRRQHAGGHFLGAHVEPAVNRGDDEVEPLEHPSS